MICVVGPSGSGKTTLLNIIATIDRPTEGYVEICGIDVTKLSERKLARFRLENIGIVFQFYNLLPELTAIENIALPAMLLGIDRDKAFQKAFKLLELVGLKDKAKRKPHELSGGEQQRVAVARALINNPKIVVADEPTGNLDLESKICVLEVFKKLNREFRVYSYRYN